MTISDSFIVAIVILVVLLFITIGGSRRDK